MVKLQALNVPFVEIKELQRIPEKDEIFEVSEERAQILTTSNNDAGEPVAVIYKEPKKDEKVTPKANKKLTKGKKK